MKQTTPWKKRFLAVVSSCTLAITGTVAAFTSGLSASAVDLDLDNYARLLQYSLYFYDANFCGDSVGEDSAFSWRDDCHTGDLIPGGLHDAGDSIISGSTLGFTASTLGWSYWEYKDEYDSTGTTQHLKAVLDYCYDFMKASTTMSNGTVTSLVYQVGNAGNDHNYWCKPEVMYDRGSSETYTTTNAGSDVAAQYAASLAQDYMFFQDDEALEYAVALYNFADKYRAAAYDNATYQPQWVDGSNSYGGSMCQDFISWAAGWLYLATGESKYLEESNKYYSFNLYWDPGYFYGNVWLGAGIINAEITGNWSNITTKLSSVTSANSYNNWNADNYYCFNNQWGSARYNTLMQFCALVTSKYSESGADYTTWAQNQMNIILGENSKNVCLVIGYNDYSATSPHHRAASNLSSMSEFNSWDGKYSSSGGHTLYGALAGGPQDVNFSSYNDIATDYNTNEVAIDYQAGLTAASVALLAAFGSSGNVVDYIGDEVTVYPDEVTVAQGGTIDTGDGDSSATQTDPVVTTEATETETEPVVTESSKTTADVTSTLEESETTEPAVEEEVILVVPETMYVGETAQIEVQGRSDAPTWYSLDNYSCVSISNDGLISAFGTGTVTITAHFSDNTEASATIQVLAATEPAVTEDTSDTGSASTETETEPAVEEEVILVVPETMYVGETAQIEVQGRSDAPTWYSQDNYSCVSISNDGLISAFGTGTVTITAHFSDNTEASATIQILAATEPAVEEEEIVYGDITLDGTIDLSDVVYLVKGLTGQIDMNETSSQAADCNSDGVVSTTDAIVLIRYTAGLIPSLPYTG